MNKKDYKIDTKPYVSKIPFKQVRKARPSYNYRYKWVLQKDKEINSPYTFTNLVRRLTKYFSLPQKELIRFSNCLFHEILSVLREGYSIGIPYFGTFYGNYFTTKHFFNIGLNQYNNNPKIVQRCYPAFWPTPYAVAVCSPKNAYYRPLRFLSKQTRNIPKAWGLMDWHKAQQRYVHRSLMCRDNPYTLSGVFESYRLKESCGVHYPSDTDEEEIKDLLRDFKDEVYKKAKRVCKRLTRKDFFAKGKHLYSYYNYLPGKYFVGMKNNFECSPSNKHLSAWDIVHKENLDTDLSTNHLPEKAPSDFRYGNVEQEFTPEATGFSDNLFEETKEGGGI